MKNLLETLALLVVGVALAGCGGGGDHKDHDHKDEAGHKDHDHKDEAGHKDHDHKDEAGHKDHGHGKDGHGGHGERHELGKADIGGFSVAVATLGEIEAGHEGVLDVEVSGGAPAAVRAWVGVESGQGSLKAKLDKEGDDYHGHVEVPATLPSGSAVWVEIEDAQGKRSTASFKLK
mgnify:CR=1 FL=1